MLIIETQGKFYDFIQSVSFESFKAFYSTSTIKNYPLIQATFDHETFKIFARVEVLKSVPFLQQSARVLDRGNSYGKSLPALE